MSRLPGLNPLPYSTPESQCLAKKTQLPCMGGSVNASDLL